MACEWHSAPLGELISYIGKGVVPKYIDDGPDATMVLGQKCVRNQALQYEQARFHNSAEKAVNPDKEVRRGDILINATGVGSAGRVAQVMADPSRQCITDGHVITLRAKDVNPFYLGYFVKSKQNAIELMAEGSTGQTEMNRQRLQSEIIVTFPESKDLQKRIAEYGLAIDKKIAVNSQLNDYLVELLDALFAKALEETSDWSEATLLDIANYKNGLAMQKFRPEGNDPGLPVLKIKELGQGTCSADSERCRSDIDEAVHIYDGDLVFSWSGTLLLDFWAGGDAGLNQHLFKVTSEEYPTWFYYAWTKYHMRKFVALAKDRATTMGHIKRSALAEAKVLIPPSKAFGKLDSQMQPIVDQMINLKVEARKLGEFRDSLLPKLMSGEIDVSKIDLMQPANNHLADC